MEASDGRKSTLDVLALAPDLFFASRLRSLCEAAGRSIQVVESLSRLEIELTGRCPALVLIDLGARGIDAPAAVRLAKRAGGSQVVAFGPHKDLDARAAALSAGADRWLSNQNLLTTFRSLFGTASA